MKNRYYEYLKKQAKLSHRNSRRTFENGIVIHHLYDEENRQKISWWDDVAFILNDYLVKVAWTHPRYDYKSEVKDIASANCAHLRARKVAGVDTTDIFGSCTPNYINVGKSRKKIASYTWNRVTDDGYYEALKKEQARVATDANNGISIKPVMTVEWTDWSKFVCINAPIEVNGIAGLHELAKLTKAILKRETTLEREFPGYAYSQKDWITEQVDGQSIGDLSHAINM